MSTLLIRLVGPMQSWGTTSRFDQRDSGKEPSKSGVIGLLAAALGIDRENWDDLEPFTHVTMGVRHDRPGVPKVDYHTAGCSRNETIIKADGSQSKDGVVSRRSYLADAAFLVAVEHNDKQLLKKAHAALQNPVWPLALGRKSYPPSEPTWVKDGLLDCTAREALQQWPWIGIPRGKKEPPEKLMISVESKDRTGTLKMDQPLSSFADRKFGVRFVYSEWVKCPGEESDVSK